MNVIFLTQEIVLCFILIKQQLFFKLLVESKTRNITLFWQYIFITLRVRYNQSLFEKWFATNPFFIIKTIFTYERRLKKSYSSIIMMPFHKQLTTTGYNRKFLLTMVKLLYVIVVKKICYFNQAFSIQITDHGTML